MCSFMDKDLSRSLPTLSAAFPPLLSVSALLEVNGLKKISHTQRSAWEKMPMLESLKWAGQDDGQDLLHLGITSTGVCGTPGGVRVQSNAVQTLC